MQPKRWTSFILRLAGEPSSPRYELQNLKTGEKRRFTSWADLRTHLEAEAQRRGLR